MPIPLLLSLPSLIAQTAASTIAEAIQPKEKKQEDDPMSGI